jgi:hypothetical protein
MSVVSRNACVYTNICMWGQPTLKQIDLSTDMNKCTDVLAKLILFCNYRDGARNLHILLVKEVDYINIVIALAQIPGTLFTTLHFLHSS